MSTENLFKPSNRKDCRGVVLLCCVVVLWISWKVLEFLWIVARPTHIAFAILLAEKSAIWAVLILEETRKPEENPSREAEKVPAKSKGAGKRLFCERTPANTQRSQQTYA